MATTARGSSKAAPSVAASRAARQHLSRDIVLRAGQRLIDEQGLDGFTMRKLAQALGVDPMAIYNYVEDKAGHTRVRAARVRRDAAAPRAGWL